MLFLLFIGTTNIYSQTDTSIRKIDWNDYLTKDKKHFTICTDCNYNSAQPVFTINGSDNQGALGSVSYLDFNHDDREDAIVELSLDGTGHCTSTSFILFLHSSTGPAKSIHDGNCQFVVYISNDTIMTARPLFGPGEPIYIPSEFETTPIVWENGRVQRLKPIVKPMADNPIDAVETFYLRVNGGIFEVAYDFLSSDYKKKNPYARWVEGYKNTTSVKAVVDSTLKDDRVQVKISSTDTINGKEIHRRYEGSWKVKLDTTNPYHIRWQLSDPRINEVK